MYNLSHDHNESKDLHIRLTEHYSKKETQRGSAPNPDLFFISEPKNEINQTISIPYLPHLIYSKEIMSKLSPEAKRFFEYRESTKYPEIVQCFKCGTKKARAHLILFRFVDKNWESKYLVGCSHAEYDGKSWCDGCMTIVDGHISCSRCANLEWGCPFAVEGEKLLNYLWDDESTSQYPRI